MRYVALHLWEACVEISPQHIVTRIWSFNASLISLVTDFLVI